MEDILIRQVVARFQVQAREFNTPEALQDYLRKHPDADKSKHTVKKTEQKAPPAKEPKPKPEPKEKPEKAPPKDKGEDDHDEGHDDHEEKPKKSWKDRLKGLSDKATGFLKSAPKQVKKFVSDDAFRRKTIMSAHDSLVNAPEKIVKNAIKTVKEEVHEYKEAGAGIKAVLSGKKMTKHQKKAVRTVATHMAIGIAAAALTSTGPLAAAGLFGKNMVKHVAMKAVSNALGHMHVLEELGHVGHGIAHVMEKLSAEDKGNPDKVFANLIAAAVAKEIKNLKDDDLKAALEMGGDEEKPVGKNKKAADARVIRNVVARFKRARMSIPEAEKILGVRPGASPEEIKAAHKKKVMELHPDLNRDRDTTEEMAQANAAKDVLDGKTPAAPSYGGGGSSYSPPRTRYEPPKPKVVTFEDAYGTAGVPSGVEWLFITDMQRGTGYNSDEFTRSNTAKVAYGRTGTKHVFLGMGHKVYQEHYIGGRANDDTWFVASREFPISGDEGKTPAWLYGNVVKALKACGSDAKFNSKVFDLKGKGWHPTRKDTVQFGSAMSIKHWLVNAEEVDEDDEAVATRKQVVEIKTTEDRFSEGEKPGFFKHPTHDWESTRYQLTLIINAKEFDLNEADFTTFMKVRGLYEKVFGRYVYGGKSKNLTRSKDGKKILQWMSEKFTGLPPKARDALAAASAQMKG